MPHIDAIDFKTLATLSAEQAHKYLVIPYRITANELTCIAATDSQVNTRELEFVLGKKINLERIEREIFVRQ